MKRIEIGTPIFPLKTLNSWSIACFIPVNVVDIVEDSERVTVEFLSGENRSVSVCAINGDNVFSGSMSHTKELGIFLIFSAPDNFITGRRVVPVSYPKAVTGKLLVDDNKLVITMRSYC